MEARSGLCKTLHETLPSKQFAKVLSVFRHLFPALYCFQVRLSYPLCMAFRLGLTNLYPVIMFPLVPASSGWLFRPLRNAFDFFGLRPYFDIRHWAPAVFCAGNTHTVHLYTKRLVARCSQTVPGNCVSLRNRSFVMNSDQHVCALCIVSQNLILPSSILAVALTAVSVLISTN